MRKNFVHIIILTAIISIGFSAFCGKEALAAGKIPIPFIINIGKVIYPLGPIPDELATLSLDPDIENWKLGYLCQHIGIFYADIWCWNKQLVIYKGDIYDEIPDEIREEFEPKYPFSETERSAWNRYGIFFLIVIATMIFIALIAIGYQQETISDEEVEDDYDMQSEYEQNEYAGMDEDDHTECPKCGSERNPGETECPVCGIVYKKYKQYMARKNN